MKLCPHCYAVPMTVQPPVKPWTAARLMNASRVELARGLLEVMAGIEGELAAIEQLKGELKARGAAGGFTETVAGVGVVKVTAATAGKFHGVVPVLVPELFLALEDDMAAELRKQGVVVDHESWSRGASASVRPTLSV